MSSHSSHSGRPGESGTETTISSEHRLDVLGDECSRTILVAASDGPRTAKELTELTESSSATVYRRINDLLEGAFLEECIRFEEGGTHTTAYRATVDHVRVEIAPSGIDVDVSAATE